MPTWIQIRIPIFLVLISLIAVFPVSGQNRTLYMPALQAAGPAEVSIALVNSAPKEATVTLTARTYDGAIIEGSGITNPVTVTLPEGQISRRASEIFGPGIYNQSGWVEASSSSPAVKGFVLVFNNALSSMEGLEFATAPSNRIVFPKVTGSGESPTRLSLVNTAATSVPARMSLYENNGDLAGTWDTQLPGNSGFNRPVRELIPLAADFEGYAVVETTGASDTSSNSLIGLEAYAERADLAIVSAFSPWDQLTSGFFAQIASHNGFESTLTLVNFSRGIQVLRITAGGLMVNGRSMGSLVVERVLSPNERLEETAASLFGFSPQDQIEGFIRFDSPVDGPGVVSFMRYGTTDGVTLSTLPAQADGYWDLYFPRVAEQSLYYTGFSIVNPNDVYADVTLDLFNDSGAHTASTAMRLMPGDRRSGLLQTFFNIPGDQFSGYVRLAATQPILGQEFIGTTTADASLASITPELVGPVASDLAIPPTDSSLPWISSLTPSESELREKRVDVEIAGGGFTADSIVNYDGVSIRSTLINPALIAVTLLNPQLRIGPHTVEVVNPATGGTSNAVAFTVLPNTVNEAPFVDAGPDQAVTLATAVLDGVASDDQLPAGSSVTTTWSTLSGPGMVTFGDLNALRTTASFSSAGTYVLRLTATDTALYSSDDVIVTVNTQNIAPIVNSGPDQTITLPASANLAGLIADDGLPAGASVTTTWSMLSGPGTVTFGDVNALRTTASFSVAGTYALRLTADDTGLFNYDDVIITVNPYNVAPIVNSGPDQTITLPASANLAGLIADDGLPAGASVTTTWSMLSGPATVTFGDVNALRTTASFSVAGTYALRLTANDTGLFNYDDVIITVNPYNVAPIVNSGPDQTITLPASANLAGLIADDGLPTGASVTTAWSMLSGPGTVAFGDVDALRTTASFSAPGTYALRLTAGDTALFNYDDVIVTVNPYNVAPIVNSGPDQIVTWPASANLTGLIADDGLPTGASVTTEWSMLSGPGTVTFGNVNALNTAASFSAPGTYALRLTAGDTALFNYDDVIVTVNPYNVAPIVNSGPDQTITLPASANLAGLIADDGLPAGASVTTAWSMLSGPGTVAFGDVNALHTTASFSAPGTYALRLTAGDTALFNYDDLVVTVNALNLAPVVNAGLDQTITLPDSASLTGIATDDGLPGGVLGTTWSKSSGPGTVTFANVNSLSTTAVFSDPGTYVLQLTATDSLLSTSSTLTVTVAAALLVPSGTYYVSTTGNDANAGTPTSPWRTIQKAAGTLAPGQTVVVSAGTYNERVLVSKSGSSGSLITFQTQGTVIMQGFNVQASYIKISGFEITNVPGNDLFNRAASSGVYLSGSNNEISGTYIHGANAAGIYMTTGTTANNLNSNRIVSAVEAGIYVQGTNHMVVSNDISHTVQTHPGMINSTDADGIRFFGSGSTFRKNYIHDITLADAGNASPHIDAFQTWGPCSNMIIEQNTILQMESPDQGIIIEGLTQPVGNITIRNNVLMTNGTGYAPAVMAGDVGLVTNVTIVNNTMVALNGPSEYAIWLFKNLQGAVIKNNAIYDHGKSSVPYIRIDSGATGLDIGSNSISKSDNVAPSGSAFPGDLWMVQPQFMKFSSRDFHLQDASPLINAGVPVSSVTNDMDGMPRSASTIDIGAFEKQ